MRKIAKLEIKNDFVVKGQQFEGVRKVGKLEEALKAVYDAACEEIFLVDNTKSVFGLEPNYEMLEKAASLCHLPITFGGGLSSYAQVLKAFDLGASRIYLNSILFEDISFIQKIADICGSQAITGGLEVRKSSDKYECYAAAGREPTNILMQDHIQNLIDHDVGELLISSIDQDGTMLGFDLDILDNLPSFPLPVIICGGGTQRDFDAYQQELRVDGMVFSSVVLGL